MNFTWESLDAATQALNKLYEAVRTFSADDNTTIHRDQVETFRAKFRDAIGNDMNTAESLAVIWEINKSNLSGNEKNELLFDLDQVLGLKLKEASEAESEPIPAEAQKLLEERNQRRTEKKFTEADQIRETLLKMGYTIKDTVGKSVLIKTGR